MATVTGASRPTPAVGWRPALVTGACGSAMAGLVHAAAAGSHEGDPLLMWLFSVCAALQVLWAVVVLLRPERLVIALGLLFNAGAVAVWALTRSVGISFVDSLAEVEAVGTPDLAAALFAGAAVMGALLLLVRPRVEATITPVWAGALAVVAMVGAVPALGAGHAHSDHGHLETASHEEGAHPHGEDEAAHGHDDASVGDDHGHEEATTDDGHGHDDAATGDLVSHDEHGAGDDHTGDDGTGHDHPPTTDGTHPHPDDPAVPHDPDDHPHPPDDPAVPTGPIISVDDPRLTSAQRATATSLINEMKAHLAGFADVAAVEAAGYISIGDGGSDGYEHFVHWGYLLDGIEMDPTKVESIVVKKSSTGPKTIVSGMYILNLGKTMAQVPDLAGELTTWHYHDNLCFEGPKLVGLASGGVCQKGTLLVTPPMLHVWLVEHPCGPFAGIETHGGGGCGAHDDH
jgi:hypothetical protein